MKTFRFVTVTVDVDTIELPRKFRSFKAFKNWLDKTAKGRDFCLNLNGKDFGHNSTDWNDFHGILRDGENKRGWHKNTWREITSVTFDNTFKRGEF